MPYVPGSSATLAPRVMITADPAVSSDPRSAWLVHALDRLPPMAYASVRGGHKGVEPRERPVHGLGGAGGDH